MLLTRALSVMIAGITLCVASTHSAAHARYILPTHTVLSGDTPREVTLQASISNDVFHPDRPFGDNGEGTARGKVNKMLQGIFSVMQSEVHGPKGESLPAIDWQAYARLSIADLAVSNTGTYRVGVLQPEVLMTTFTNAQGKPGRVFANTPLPEDLVLNSVVRHTTASRIQTFITFNDVSGEGWQPLGNGLELGGETHPNDVFIGESASWQLHLDGQALDSFNGEPVTLHITPAGTRHRNQRETIEVIADAAGRFEVNFERAGLYLLEAEFTRPGVEGSGVALRHNSLYLTLEVFP